MRGPRIGFQRKTVSACTKMEVGFEEWNEKKKRIFFWTAIQILTSEQQQFRMSKMEEIEPQIGQSKHSQKRKVEPAPSKAKKAALKSLKVTSTSEP